MKSHRQPSAVPSDYNNQQKREPLKPIENVIGVRPYSKVHISQIPGSSPMPNTRSNDLVYKQQYGKGPLIERAERLKRLHDL